MRPQGLSALLLCVHLLCSVVAAQTAPPPPPALETITASKLRGHVSFLASDLLEGRDSPSRGLDVAAEYLASQFRALDLEPLGDNGYFQTLHWTILEAPPTGITLSLDGAPVDPKHFRITAGAAPIEAEGDLADLKPGETAGRIVRLADANRNTVLNAIPILRNAPPTLVLIPDESDSLSRSGSFQSRAILTPYDPPRGNYVYVLCTGPAAALLKSAKTARFHMPAGTTTPARLWNVAGLLRGSDPALASTAVIVSAHYDHEGLRPNNPTDQVMNGANDDASGVAAMLETARALAALPQRPKRSILFLAFVGEEKGLLGSKHYAKNPLWPLDKTVANLNLEMFGRTEEGEYTRAGQMTITGSGFSTVTDFVRQAALDLGAIYFINRQGNEEFFARSDNFPLAMAGIPAHSMTPGFSFQDYHDPGDEWPKLDYDNMQRATRIAALATLRIANSETAPEWDLNDPTAKKFADQRKPAAPAPPNAAPAASPQPAPPQAPSPQ